MRGWVGVGSDRLLLMRILWIVSRPRRCCRLTLSHLYGILHVFNTLYLSFSEPEKPDALAPLMPLSVIEWEGAHCPMPIAETTHNALPHSALAPRPR